MMFNFWVQLWSTRITKASIMETIMTQQEGYKRGCFAQIRAWAQEKKIEWEKWKKN